MTFVPAVATSPDAAPRLLRAVDLLSNAELPTPGLRVWSDDWGLWCHLRHLRAAPQGNREQQLRALLEQAERELVLHGLGFEHVVRTWFCLDEILEWYGAFNRVRTEFFRERGLLTGAIPASTAVGGSNAAGSAVAASLLAVRPHDERLRVTPLPSPRQCEATRYASSFSRALQVSWPGARRVWISGTAAIDARGDSLHPGDGVAQIEATLDVVRDLLGSAHLSFQDVLEARAYFRRVADARHLGLVRRRLGAGRLQAARAEICRDELLFELELTAGTGPSVMPGWLP